MVQEDVALAHMVENVGLRLERDDRAGGEALVAQLRAVDLHRERHESREIQRTVDAVDILLLEVEDFEEPLLHMRGAVFFHFEAHGGAALHLAQFLLDGVEQVARLLLVDIEVAVARDAEEVSALDLHPAEKRLHMLLDDVSEEDIVVAAGLRGKRHEPRQDARGLDDCDVGADAITFELDDDIQAFVEELRKRVRGVDRKRREDGINGLEEKFFKMSALCGGNIRVVVEADALRLELGGDGFAPAAVLVLHHAANAGADLRQCLRGGEPIGTGLGGIRLVLLFQARNADLEKFIKVRADDAEELQPLEHGIRFVDRLVQHALVELEPTQLAVDEVRTVRKVHTSIQMTHPRRSRADLKRNRRFIPRQSGFRRGS